MSNPLVYHLDARECAALDRGNQTEREHIERHAGAVAHRLRAPVSVCCDGSARCYFTIDETGRVIESDGVVSAAEIGEALNHVGGKLREAAGALVAARRAVKEKRGAAEACAMFEAADPPPGSPAHLIWIALEGAELSGDYADAEAALDAIDRGRA